MHSLLPTSFPLTAALRLDVDTTGYWQALEPTPQSGHAWRADFPGGNVSLEVEAPCESAASGLVRPFRLSVTSQAPVRLRLRLELPEAREPFPILPGFLFGDNNLAHVKTDDRFPHLTEPREDRPNFSPYWECRADRLSHPAALVAMQGGAVALAIDPYTDGAEGAVGPGVEDGLRNGCFVQAPGTGRNAACGVTFGYRNDPACYVHKGAYAPATEHRLCCGEVRGSLHAVEGTDRLAVHRIVRDLYARYRAERDPRLETGEALRRLVRAMCGIGWSEADQDFHDLRWDPADGQARTLRGPNHEISWTGGTETAYPLIVYGRRFGDEDALAKGRTLLDRIARPASINPKSGFFWDRVPAEGEPDNNGWWAGMTGHQHCAYTNGQACYYLLEAARFEGEAAPPAWRETALRVLDQALRAQAPDGNFGYTFTVEDGSIADPEGFAGCWFVPALALAYAHTGEARYRDSAERALAHYGEQVRRLEPYGTPMDTFGAIDQEGVLAFIRGARLWHETTGEAAFLNRLAEGAAYEYLWRYAYRARAQEPPLRGSPWNSLGGSHTSVCNPCIHPMGLLVTSDLGYLARHTGDPYHADRRADALAFVRNALSLYPDTIGYGEAGVLTERWCPSDGLLIEKYADGSPASVWFTFHIWAAGNAVEGLLDDRKSG